MRKINYILKVFFVELKNSQKNMRFFRWNVFCWECINNSVNVLQLILNLVCVPRLVWSCFGQECYFQYGSVVVSLRQQ